MVCALMRAGWLEKNWRQLEIRFYGPEIERVLCGAKRTPLILSECWANRENNFIALWVSPACHTQREPGAYRWHWALRIFSTSIKGNPFVPSLHHRTRSAASCLFCPTQCLTHYCERAVGAASASERKWAAICYFSSTIAQRWVDFYL